MIYLSTQLIEVNVGDVLGVYQPNSEDAQYTLGFLSEGNNIDIPTDYIMYDVDPSTRNFDIVDEHEELSMLPLVLLKYKVREVQYQ